MGNLMLPGDLVEINFSTNHRESYPAYSRKYQGKNAVIVKAQKNTFFTIRIVATGIELCIEREFLRSVAPFLSSRRKTVQ